MCGGLDRRMERDVTGAKEANVKEGTGQLPAADEQLTRNTRSRRFLPASLSARLPDRQQSPNCFVWQLRSVRKRAQGRVLARKFL